MDYLKAVRVVRLLGIGGCLALMLTGARVQAGAGNPATNAPNRDADARLLVAARKGDANAVKSAIGEGANVNARGTNGLTPLLEAFHGATSPLNEEQHQAVAVLLEHGAGNAATDAEGRTALICAARLGDLESVRQLVEAGALVKARDSFHKTALFYAVEMKRRDIAVYLASNGDLQSTPYEAKKQEKR